VVTASRFNPFYGKKTSVKIVDLGLVNQTTTLLSGLQWGFVNCTEGKASGVWIAAINIIQESGFLPACVIANG
jgi:hypothetical protein